MSNYTKTVDFAAKDGLSSGASGKIIKGTEFETEFDNIVTAIATKADIAGPTFTGTATFATLSDGTIAVTAFADEDNMSSNSATLVPTQQSVKAYVDASASSTEAIQDIAGAMFTSNTETGITATYQDADGTIDLVVGTLNQDTTGTAAIATTVTIADNESTNENNAIIFTAGGDLDGGNLGLESDGDLHYNPSTGLLTATSFAGALTGNVTGNASGTAATVTGAAQSNITSVGTLTALVVDDVSINGATIGHTGDTDLMTVASGVLTVAGEVSMTTLDIGGTNVTSTATEINQLDALTRGSILYGNASAVTTRLAAGSANYVLTSDGTDISWAAAGGAYSSWLVKTANFTCADGDQLVCNHASTAFTITLPSGTTVGRTVTISNIGAATVTVGRNSQPIDSTASDATLLTDRSTQLVYVDTTIGWKELP
jgi:hypothetical protein